MDASKLDIIKRFPLSIKVDNESDEFCLEDEIGGDIFFTVKLSYVQSIKDSVTDLKVSDAYHACILVGTQPNESVSSKEPLEIGTFKKKDLFMSVSVAPIKTDGTHDVVVSFFVSK